MLYHHQSTPSQAASPRMPVARTYHLFEKASSPRPSPKSVAGMPTATSSTAPTTVRGKSERVSADTNTHRVSTRTAMPMRDSQVMKDSPSNVELERPPADSARALCAHNNPGAHS